MSFIKSLVICSTSLYIKESVLSGWNWITVSRWIGLYSVGEIRPYSIGGVGLHSVGRVRLYLVSRSGLHLVSG